MAATLSVRPSYGLVYHAPRCGVAAAAGGGRERRQSRWWAVGGPPRPTLVAAASRADEPPPSEMSVESALKVLGVGEGASFDEILRAKNSILASCKDDQKAAAQDNLTKTTIGTGKEGEGLYCLEKGTTETEIKASSGLQVAKELDKVEAAYDMLLMQSFTRRRAGKVMNSGIRYADVKRASGSGINRMPQWLQNTVKNAGVSIETPSSGSLGVQVGIYGALMTLTFVNGASIPSAAPYAGADVPGLILASSFGASLYFLTKKNINLGKATIITVGGLVVGAVVGSAVENWLQVDIVPFFGVHSPAAIVGEFIIFSQLLASLYLR